MEKERDGDGEGEEMEKEREGEKDIVQCVSVSVLIWFGEEFINSVNRVQYRYTLNPYYRNIQCNIQCTRQCTRQCISLSPHLRYCSEIGWRSLSVERWRQLGTEEVT